MSKEDWPQEWVSVFEGLPPTREKAYQVIVICYKKHREGNYEGRGIRRFVQDWVVRNWPENFTHWAEAMPWPEEVKK